MTRGARRRRLIRARDLAEFRAVLAALAEPRRDASLRRRAFVLPTTAAIEMFRQTLERAAIAPGRAAVLLPDLLTRSDWLDRLHQSLPGGERMLTAFEREVLMARAARAAASRARMPGAPFEIRSGLVAEMLGLYDELRRRQRTVRRFAHVLFRELGVERGTDRGSESLIHQTCFLAFAFLGYERGRAGAGALDEHELRHRIAERGAMPFDQLVVAVADHPSDPRGLWPADFDLLSRTGQTIDLDVVVTDETHDAGFRARVEEELPGIEETRGEEIVGAREPRNAILVTPPKPLAGSTRAGAASPEARGFVHRDREEELRSVVRLIRAEAARTDYQLREPAAIVFQRPLPYVYLARQIFLDARVPFYTLDALPLAREPYAALLDLVLEAVRTGGLRQSLIALLRSPLLHFENDGAAVTLQDAAALDLVLTERRSACQPAEFPAEVDAYFGARPYRNGCAADDARRAARAAAGVAAALAWIGHADRASSQLRAVSAFLREHERAADASASWFDRYRRGRAAVLGMLAGLADAFARHDDRPLDVDTLTSTVHHWIERHTFAPERRERAGVCLVDAVAARFGEFDHVHVVGLVENEWPERMRRSIFYTSGLLRSLGWAQNRDQTAAQQAAFRDLLRLPARTLRLHGFLLEGDTVVAMSPFLELARGLPTRADDVHVEARVFADELLTDDASTASVAAGAPQEWLRLRAGRSPLRHPRFSGHAGPQAPQQYRVSKVDRYVDCPFKYFAETVLGLPEEREEQSGLSPLERGTLVHTVFEDFYRRWHADGHGTITPGTLPVALEMFGAIARAALAPLPAADRALEEVRLLGSIVARGMAERIFELEADAGGEIADRLLEIVLKGTFRFPRMHGFGERAIEISGKADRVDVFRNGELRVVDYKLSRLPDVDSSIQIAAYAWAVQQLLEKANGRAYQVTHAMYVAFGDERQTEGRLAAPGADTIAALTARASEFADVIDRIERGEFPASPRRPSDCAWCRFAGVCRKEYSTIDAAEPV